MAENSESIELCTEDILGDAVLDEMLSSEEEPQEHPAEKVEELSELSESSDLEKNPEAPKEEIAEDLQEKQISVIQTPDGKVTVDANKELQDLMEEEEAKPPKPSIEEDLDSIINLPQELMGAGTVPAPTIDKALEDPTKDDALLDTIRQEEPTLTLYNSIMEEIATELAVMKYLRHELFLNGSDKEIITDVSFKRVKSLTDLVKTLAEREKSRDKKDGKIDFHGEKFERVVKHFLDVVQRTFNKVNIPEQFQEVFFIQLSKELEGYEKKVEKLYYGKK